ncbi:CidA/LrgA family protein [Mediterraneibacter glycyrrhizinilyticus]|nr:CidA/LrgA family protein [Mediterraneibacter glycyrrhizinilyticus]MCB6309025.1 CidA/LrgA family protein [Lachnospiraceae bacterium 210521-DFI.1.109]MCB6427692.1 CidA/LrgA family protein [Mediterraneibacter glycyrrhizinilyticus]
MKYIRQFGIICGVTCMGEILKYLLPLPIPGSIYGLGLMLLFLSLKVIKIESVREVGEFLIEIMPVMFIPAGVGLITAWGKLKTMLVPVGIITVVTTFLVLIVTGKVTEMMLKQKEKKQTEKMQTGEKEEQDGSGDL